MEAFVSTVVIGIFVCVIGAINMRGNISSLHWYHRKRVTEENIKPFGKLVGLGTLIIGISLLIFGTLSFMAEKMQLEILLTIGIAELIASIVVGLAISFYAMKKYNGGIF